MTDYVGLSHFQHYFHDMKEHYVVVGGFATVLLLDRGLGDEHTKATHDIDLVLLTTSSEALSRKIKSYVSEGGYTIQKGQKDQYNYFRFLEPKEEGFAQEIELFASNEQGLELDEVQRIIPIDPEEGLYSLSAIMLDPEYFAMIKENIETTEGTPHTNSAATIMLKMSAFYDLKERGERKWKKHRQDILKLLLTMTGEERIGLVGRMVGDFESFMEHLEGLDQKTINAIVGDMPTVKKSMALDTLEKVFTVD